MAREHIRAFQDVPGVTVAGIHSRTRGKAEAIASEFGIEVIADSMSSLWEQSRADLVLVAVSISAMSDVCVDAFKHPWTCLIEKPAGFNFDEAARVAAAAQRQGARAFVALNRRHYSSTRAVLSDLAASDDQRLIHVQDQEDLRVARTVGHPDIVIANWMYANSIHCVDYLRIFGRGEVISVEPIVRWNASTPRFVLAKVAFSSGDIGFYEAVWNGPGPWAVTVTTQEKRWELRPLERASFQMDGSRKVEPIEVDRWDCQFKPGFRFQAGEAVRAAQGQPHVLPTLEDALASMRLVQQVYA